MRPRLPSVAAIFVLAAIGLAACGGQDESDTAAIADAAKRIIVTEDEVTSCETLLTAGFVRRIYGDPRQCRRALRPEPDEEPATDAKVSDVRTDGNAATVTIRVVGGSSDGTGGTLALRNEDGGWRLDDVGVDYMRSSIRAGVAETGNERFKSCAQRRFRDLPDDQLRRAASRFISERPGSDAELLRLLGSCLAIPGTGRSSPRASQLDDQLAAGIREAVGDKAPKDASDCVVRRLHSLFSTDQLLDRIFTERDRGRLQDDIVRALARCSPNALRAITESRVRQNLDGVVPKETLDCFIRRLRTSISDEELLALALADRARSEAAGARAMTACRRQ